MRLRLGLVGAGWAAREHTASLAALGEAPPVLVTDLDRPRAEALARDCGARVAEDLDEFTGLDAVVVTTPAGVHAAAVLPLLAAGVAVFVEKPLALTVADAAAVVAAAGTVPVAVGYQWRAVPALAELERELAGQHIAMLISQGVGITQARSWFGDATLSGGLVGERGSHHLDLLGHLAGPVARVHATCGGGVRVSGERPGGPSDVVAVTCTFDSGAVSTTALVWASERHLPEQSLRVVADGGHYLLALDPDFRLTGRTGRRAVSYHDPEVPFVRQLARFLGAVRSGDPSDVFCPPDQAARTVAVVVAARSAMDSGRPEPVSGVCRDGEENVYRLKNPPAVDDGTGLREPRGGPARTTGHP